ncbi:MAG: Sua5/YciO/YrdC/YwlC family protein [Neisseriaceae bacterium]
MHNKEIAWNGGVQLEALEVLSQPGGVIVSPTKVGYIIMATDLAGLERKFEAKQRKKSKPAVVLCSSLEQFKTLAAYDSKILELYEMHWEQDVLLGCILPWSSEGWAMLEQAGTQSLVTDARQTSCFVIKFGTPSELIAGSLWQKERKITFASSANPSGVGNRGKVAGIGQRIEQSVDLIISADEYVSSIQPGNDEHSRYEQGVMISLVDDQGALVTNSEVNYPSLIRKGLSMDKIMVNLSRLFDRWDYRHGSYY